MGSNTLLRDARGVAMLRVKRSILPKTIRLDDVDA